MLVEQPYRVAGRRSPAPARQLDAAWTAVVDHLVGGVSYADCRCSSAAAPRARGWRAAPPAETAAVGVLCLAFPLQPPRRSGSEPAPSRLPELDAVTVPTLVVQGVRDPFGIPPAGEHRTVVQVESDHGLKGDLDAVAAAVRAWLPQLVLASG